MVHQPVKWFRQDVVCDLVVVDVQLGEDDLPQRPGKLLPRSCDGFIVVQIAPGESKWRPHRPAARA